MRLDYYCNGDLVLCTHDSPAFIKNDDLVLIAGKTYKIIMSIVNYNGSVNTQQIYLEEIKVA